MKTKQILALAAIAALASCSSNDLVSPPADSRTAGEVPIEFNVQKQNITRAANLETVKHYNFGVWAWKVGGKNALADMEVMNNYLVGWSGTASYPVEATKGYKVGSLTTTYATTPGSVLDHKSPWFYEGLGTSEYTHNTASEGYYYVNELTTDKPMAWVDYKSNNTNQYLRYWDLAYTNTNFYCYAPYNANVTFAHAATTSTMTFPATGSIRDGYDMPRDHKYDAYSRTLGEFMYAGVQANNASLADVTVPFKHMGAQLFIRFYEDIPGYKVEIIDLGADNGKLKSGSATDDANSGIQATPAIQTTAPQRLDTNDKVKEYNGKLTGALNSTDALTEGQTSAYNSAMSKSKAVGATLTPDEAAAYNATLTGAKKLGDIIVPGVYTLGQYYTTQGATVTFTESNAAASYAPSWTGATEVSTPLMFLIPSKETGNDKYETYSVAPGNLTEYPGLSSTKHYVIPEKVNSGTQNYSYSPTIYYPVAQPKSGESEYNNTGLTFHVSYRIIAEDNKEVTTVHNATVHVPVYGTATGNDASTQVESKYPITAWQPNVKYTYTFKITRNSNGTTNPDTPIDPTSPSVDDTVALYPIVFDAATIDDYTENFSEYTVSEETSTEYNQPLP
jgi:hypothetical protein